MTGIREKINDKRGFSLVEAMVSMAIALIVGASFYYLYNHQHKQYLAEQNMSDLQADTRFVLESMSRDLIMAGYRPVTSPGISEASGNKMTFEYWDENADPVSPYDNHRQITFEIDTSDTDLPLTRLVQRYNPSSSSYDAGQTYTIGEHLQSLQFEYYDNQNIKIDPAPGTDANLIDDIRSFKVTVRVRSVDKDPFTSPLAYKYMTLSRTYQARNLGIAGSPIDTRSPDPPQDVEVVDPGLCGQLNVQWTANSEPDLGGYYIFIGQETGSYVEKIKVDSPTATSYTLTDLTNTMYGDSSPTTYFIAMTAYDKSANMSAFSTEVSGNPSPSVDSFSEVGSRGNDTTINPPVPSPPANFEADDGTVEGIVVLTWNATSDSDVVEYRLHRSLTAGFVPDESESSTTLLATIDSADVTYTDSGLIGCTTYYYKIASVNCDYTLVPAYTSTDYSYCFGDGSMPEIANDTPTQNVTDSTPFDNTPITGDVPKLSSYAGWKRVFLNLTNPNRGTDPDFAFTRIYWNKGVAGFPQINEVNCNVTNGSLVVDSGGTFTGEGSGISFKHDSETMEEPYEPSLENLITYYYLAVSYDQCGNCTSVTESATTLSELCGDDPAGLPQCDPSAYLTVEPQGCSYYTDLTWDGDCLKEGSDLNRDFSGFHIFRNEGETYNPDDPTHMELTGGIPQWYQNFTDASMEEGKFYSYAVKWADCAYEHENMGNISDPNLDGGLLEGISVGSISKNYTENILTGDLTLSPPTYNHNTAVVTFNNSSAGGMTIYSISMRWENPLAYLQRIIIGDNDTTTRETVWESTALPLSIGSSGGTVTLTKMIAGLDSDVPIEFHFANQDGTIDYNCDMREDNIIIEASYVNDTTADDSCGLYDYLAVPLGPSISRTTQNKPVAATVSWPVPGYAGSNSVDQVIVPGSVPVMVSSFVRDYSFVGINSVKLYYYIDETASLTSAPAYNGSNYIEVPMTFVSGNLWKLDTANEIPAYDGSSVWFFIVAIDNDGNFDRDPEPRAGAYQYYQQEANACDNTPDAPILAGETGIGAVYLGWQAPSLNTNGSPCADLAGYKLYRYNGASWTLLATLGTGTLTYTDSPPEMETNNYSYYVSAFDTCTPPNESLASNIIAECSGAPPCILSVQKSRDPFYAGDTFTINITVCDMINGLPGEVLYTQTCSGVPDADPIAMRELGDTGNFFISSAYGRDYVQTYLPDDYPVSPIVLDLKVNTTDQVTVGGYSITAYSDSLCSASFECDYTTFDVIPDPCLSPSTPDPPQNLAATRTKTSCAASGNSVILDWDPPFFGSVSFYRIYRCQGVGCNPWDLPPLTTTTDTTYTDSTVDKLDNIYRYSITAVNSLCESSPTESTHAGPVQQCP